jgi:Zn-dependent protease with chaperone function
LREGGVAVARSLDAAPVSRQTGDLAEQRLRNVVEEMALASGLPVPEVYVMDERGINAFAAGLRPEDAVIVVTRASLRHLTREELEGVIGHEFSHILNGDMRLNLQLIGAIYGLMVIAIIGRALIGGRSYGYSSERRSGGAVVLWGLGIWAIGSLGVLFGRLIQSAVSRQREALADAAGVQFTRNPGGLAGALKKIGGFGPRSYIVHAHVEETAHMFFAPALDSFFATHPPLEQRIRALDPQWDGKFVTVELAPEEKTRVPANRTPYEPAAVGFQQLLAPMSVVAAVSLANVRTWRASLPVPVSAALSDVHGCRALALALALEADPQKRAAQLEKLRQLDEPAADAAARLADAVAAIPAGGQLPLLELALSGLAPVPYTEKNSLLARLRELTGFDRGPTLHAFALWRVAEHRLRLQPPRIGPKAPDYYRDDFAVLLSALAYVGAADDAAAGPAFEKGRAAVPPEIANVALLPRAQTALDRVQVACARLEGAPFGLKKQLLEAGARVAQADGVVEPAEAEMLRALAASLGCPVPPG